MSAIWFLIVLLGPATEAVPAKSIYYRSLKQVREGKIGSAVSGLTSILEQSPRDKFADDALMELARIEEELRGKPARALELYRKLMSDYPDSRLFRRARARSEFIGKHLDQGEAVLAEYQSILKHSAKNPIKAVTEMEHLLDKLPDFSLRPDGLYWMGSVLARQGLGEQAAGKWNQVVDKYPDHEAAGRALMGLGELAITNGELDAAERAFQRLAGMPDGKWKKASREYMARLDQLRKRRWIFIAALAAWIVTLLGLWSAVVARLAKNKLSPRQLLRPPLEALIYLMVMAALIIWAASGTRQTTWALLWMTGMLTPVILPNGWLLRSRVPRGANLALWLAMLVVVCLACAVAAIVLAGMSDQVLHTLKWGPE